jgi:hypothetical protein
VVCIQYAFAVIAALPAHLTLRVFTILTETDDASETLLKFRNIPSISQNICGMEEPITDLHSSVLDGI